MKKKISVFVWIMLMAVFASACSQKTPDGEKEDLKADIVVKLALATENITQDEDISSLPEGTLCVSAAKGETEGTQFIIRSNADISYYDISVSDLKSGENTIESNAVSVQTEIYAYAAYNAKYSSSLPSGYYPDALIPVNYIVEAEENRIEADKNQGFFVDFTVPEDAAAGTYTGEITVDCQGQQIVIPVELEVYDFTISSVPYTKTCYLIWQNWLTYGEFDSTDEKYMDYYDMMLDYNICAYTFPHTTAEEFVAYVREYYSKVTCFGIPYDALTNTTNDWAKATAYVTELASAAVEDGINYFNKAYYYWDVFYDEYQEFEWRGKAMRQIFEGCDEMEENLINSLVTQKLISDSDCELAQSIRNLSHVIPGEAHNEKLEEYDITHCPGALFVDTTAAMEEYKEATPEGIDYWWYHAIGALDYPCSDKSINGYRVAGRDHFWSNYELDIVGDLFWNVSGFCNWGARDSSGAYYPLEDLYTTASHDNISNGDGYLLYPGLAYGSDRPFASLRLVALRDGIDDNTYMGMLGELYQKLAEGYHADVRDAKNLVSFINKNIISRQISKLDSRMLIDGRDALAKALVLANESGVVFENVSVEQNEISYVIYTDDSTNLTVNGNAVDFIAAGAGRRYQETIQIPESGKLVFDFMKNGETRTIELWTVKSGEPVYDFEEPDDLEKCIVYKDYGSAVTLNTSPDYAKGGNSAEVLLSGHDFGNSENNEQFMPGISFLLSGMDRKLSEIQSIEYWVYNPQSEDIVVESYLKGVSATGGKISFPYDMINLKAKSWTKITLDNFKFVSLEPEALDEYTEFGIKTSNQIGTAVRLYVDDLFIR